MVEATGVEPAQVLKRRKLLILRTDKSTEGIHLRLLHAKCIQKARCSEAVNQFHFSHSLPQSQTLASLIPTTDRKNVRSLFYFQDRSLRKHVERFGLFWWFLPVCPLSWHNLRNVVRGPIFKRRSIRPVPTAGVPAGLPGQGRRPAASFRGPISPR